MQVPNIHYITVATKPHPVLDEIRAKCHKNGEMITVLAQEENRPIGWASRGNFGVKLREVHQFITRNPALQPDDLILFTDAYDVVYCGQFAQIWERYQEFEKPIVFGAEKYCNPDPDLKSKYSTDPNAEFPYLNSGLFIGRVWALRKCMENYQYDDKHDDQRYWTNQFLSVNKPLIELDHNNRLFLNTCDIDDTQVRWSNRETVLYRNANPLFYHVNGPDKGSDGLGNLRR